MTLCYRPIRYITGRRRTSSLMKEILAPFLKKTFSYLYSFLLRTKKKKKKKTRLKGALGCLLRNLASGWTKETSRLLFFGQKAFDGIYTNGEFTKRQTIKEVLQASEFCFWVMSARWWFHMQQGKPPSLKMAIFEHSPKNWIRHSPQVPFDASPISIHRVVTESNSWSWEWRK